ncbi:MAG: hypothetical protein NVSMB51_19550 [Solirubrobacteraceae bacterium]
MSKRAQLLRTLVENGIYVVDERAVAEAILLRRTVKRAVPGIEFAGALRPPPRSFRRDDHPRSFRLVDGRSRHNGTGR